MLCHGKINKAYSMIGLIKRNFIHTDKNTFCLLYKALVRPHVEYAHSVWYPYKKQWRRKQFTSEGAQCRREAPAENFLMCPSLFSCAPHTRGHNDCLLPTETRSGEVGRGVIKVMGPYSYTHTHSISSALITGRPWVHYK